MFALARSSRLRLPAIRALVLCLWSHPAANQVGKLIFASDDEKLGLRDDVAEEMIFGGHAASQFGLVEKMWMGFPADSLAPLSFVAPPHILQAAPVHPWTATVRPLVFSLSVLLSGHARAHRDPP